MAKIHTHKPRPKATPAAKPTCATCWHCEPPTAYEEAPGEYEWEDFRDGSIIGFRRVGPGPARSSHPPVPPERSTRKPGPPA